MSDKENRKTINKCMLKILNTYVEDDCRIICIKPLYYESAGFSITLVGRVRYKTVEQVSILENDEKRTFIFQVYRDSDCYSYSDPTFIKTDHYLYKGKITEPICETVYEETADIKKDLDEPNSSASIPDPVNHPNHYEMVGPFESFDIIVESLGIYGARQFCQGNIIKYQTRYKEKNGEEDLKKRHWYDRMDQMLAKCETIKDYYKLKESDF